MQNIKKQIALRLLRQSASESDEFLKTAPPEHNEYFLDEPRFAEKVHRPPFTREARLTDIFDPNSIPLKIEAGNVTG